MANGSQIFTTLVIKPGENRLPNKEHK
uniref:Uncharacterized protein n=1 Tax=Tetranychus urticae TaxID=32264 RepID=T1KHZ4_TETUR